MQGPHTGLRYYRAGLLEGGTHVSVQNADGIVLNDQVIGGVEPRVISIEGL